MTQFTTRSPLVSGQEPDYLGAGAEAIRHHYDLPAEFFGLFLDETRTYTCALWERGDTLRAAQVRKLDHLLDGARAAGARRLLDVGCGWGSLVRRAVEHHDVRTAVGLTLSPAQGEWLAAQDLPPGVEIVVRNWADHTEEEPYDAIVSIGAFEHFAAFGLSESDRAEAYRRFFDFARAALRPGSRMALQTMAKGNNNHLDRRTVRDMMFIVEHIFPESEIPAVAEIVGAARNRFELISLRNDAHDYVRTCLAWHERLVAQRRAAVALVGTEILAGYERFLESAAEHFRKRHLGLVRTVWEAV